MQSLSRSKGFTLLEILVAIAILAVAGVALMQSTGNHIYYQSVLQQTQMAQIVASNRMAEVYLESKWPIDNGRKGDVEMVGSTWYWQQKVSKTGEEAMVKVEVTVFEDAEYQKRITGLSSYVVRKK